MTTKRGQRVVVRAYGETPLDALEQHIGLEPQDFPNTAALSSTDVVVAVRSAAVGWVDLIMSSGQYQHMGQPPYTPGLEFSGDIAWMGADVQGFEVGHPVLVDPFLVGPRTSGAYRQWGGFATFAVAPEDAIYPLPPTFSYGQGANFFGNYETAYHCLIHRGRLQPGETVLIHGASGSTGLAAVHVAKHVGATVIATGRSEEKLALVAAAGADHTICCPDGPRFRDQVKALTNGQGVDVVYDGVGGPISLESLRSVRFGARYLIVGWAATPFVAKGKGGRGAPNANQLPTNLIMMKGVDVLGCPTVIATQKDPTIREKRLGTLMAWAHTGALRPQVGKAFSLDDFREAMLAKWESRYVGGCVIETPGD